MSRLVHRKIDVQLHDEQPTTFIDSGVRHEIAHIRNWWREMGDWWEGKGERTIYQVITQDGFMYDIEVSDEGWYLYRVWD